MENFDEHNFKKYFDEFAASLESSRNYNKKIFIVMVCMGTLLILGLPFYIDWLAAYIDIILNKLAVYTAVLQGVDFVKTDYTTPFFISLYSFFIIIFSITIAVRPIFKYRGKNKKAGMVARDYSLKDHVYSHLLRYFGNFEFAPDGGTFPLDIKKSTIIPPYQVYTAEDYIKGVINECTVKIAETELANIIDKKRVAIFRGLLIIIDISETNIKLRAPFSGNTVLIADKQKNIPEIIKKYAEYNNVKLPEKEIEDMYEAFSTDVAEAEKLLSADFIKSISLLHKQLSNTKEQRQHFDDKMAYIVQALLDYTALPSIRKSPLDDEYNKLYKNSLDLTKENPISSEIDSINQSIQAEFYDDKLLITIPLKADLFETDSMFEKVINDEDRVLLFNIMQVISQITQHLNGYFKSRYN
ncbi:MAG: DUF3137 domain-containing protein [Rickettsiales bacterium]